MTVGSFQLFHFLWDANEIERQGQRMIPTSGFRLSRYALSLTRVVETVEKAFIVLKSPAEVLDSQA